MEALLNHAQDKLKTAGSHSPKAAKSFSAKEPYN